MSSEGWEIPWSSDSRRGEAWESAGALLWSGEEDEMRVDWINAVKGWLLQDFFCSVLSQAPSRITALRPRIRVTRAATLSQALSVSSGQVRPHLARQAGADREGVRLAVHLAGRHAGEAGGHPEA